MQIIDDNNKYETCRFSKSKKITTKNCTGCGGKASSNQERICKKLNIVTSKFICAVCEIYESK